MKTTTERKSRSVFFPLAFAITMRVVQSLYWVLRYGGNWVEGDTSRMTAAIQTILQNGRLISTAGRIYPSGFLHSAYGAFLSLIVNINVIEFQTWMFLPTAIGLTLLTFVFYRRILGNPVMAGAATVMLNLQGDLLFTTSRGSHEKLSFTLIFVSLLAMALATVRFSSARQRLALAPVYYLTTFALSTTNAFFASTFVAALILAFLTGSILIPHITSEQRLSMWLTYIATTSLIFIYVVVFVLYTPALSMVQTAGNLFERLRLFLFSLGEPPAAIYQAASQAWVFPQAWLVLRLFDVFLVAIATAGWLDLALYWRQRRKLSPEPMPIGHFWLLVLFPAFAIQNIGVIVSDITGSVTDIKNLQVRLVPLTAFAAAPLVAYALQRLFAALHTRRLWYRLATVSLAGAMVAFTGLALIKSTSEPLLSNNWLFYAPEEAAGVSWLNEHALLLSFHWGRRTPRVWTGPGNRLGPLWLNNYWEAAREHIPATANEPYRLVFLSPTVRMLTARRYQPLPSTMPALRIYDNGATQLYFKLPEAR